MRVEARRITWDEDAQQWTKIDVWVQLAENPFAEGNMRTARYMKMCENLHVLDAMYTSKCTQTGTSQRSDQ